MMGESARGGKLEKVDDRHGDAGELPQALLDG
jgi:hypothetical protein